MEFPRLGRCLVGSEHIDQSRTRIVGTIDFWFLRPEMLFERKAKEERKQPSWGAYPPDTELDAFSDRLACSPTQFSDHPADLFSADLRPTPPQSQSNGCGMPDRATNETETKLPSTDTFPSDTDLEPLILYDTFSRSEPKDPSNFYYPLDSNLDRLNQSPIFVA